MIVKVFFQCHPRLKSQNLQDLTFIKHKPITNILIFGSSSNIIILKRDMLLVIIITHLLI